VVEFGLPMGPYAMADLAGIDVGWRIRQHRGTTAPVSDALYEAGRYGQKTAAGYYRYEAGSRTPVPDPEVERLITEASARLGIERRPFGKDEIVERMIYPMINEGARILEEGIALRPGDIDRGLGSTATAGRCGAAGRCTMPIRSGSLTSATARLLRRRSGDPGLQPAPLLARLAAEGRGFASLAQAGKAAA
jgi:3-hydroxyacyl-CoA dehydrogenase